MNTRKSKNVQRRDFPRISVWKPYRFKGNKSFFCVRGVTNISVLAHRRTNRKHELYVENPFKNDQKIKTDRNTAFTSKIPLQNKTNGQIRWKTTFYVENPLSKLPQKETNDQTRQKARRPKKREWSNPPNTDLTLKITLKIPFTNSRKTKCTVKPDTKLEFYVENPF